MRVRAWPGWWSLGHHLSRGHRYGACGRDSAGAGVTACLGRCSTAFMTPPPPVLPGAGTGNREKRRRAPVSDHPVAVLLAGSSLPLQGVELPLALPEAQVFTGIDWAAATHAVCVLNAAGKVVAEFTVEHSADGIATLIRRLSRFGDPGDVPIGIERPDGRLVDLL